MENFVSPKDSQILEANLSRRQLIKGVGNLGLLMATPSLLTLSSKTFASVPEKSLNVYNTHTGESLKKCAFWFDGKLNSEAMADLSWLFRDHRTNQECAMDPNLMHLIHNILEKTGSRQMIHLISGYRSPKTNTMLRKKSCGVASNSQHLTGKAADIMIPDRTMKQVQQAAKTLKAGGVGRYAQFVHVDTGRVRYWGPA